MLGGAIGGWLVFLIALIYDARSSGKLDALGRLPTLLRRTTLRRRWARSEV
jgi:hypothetical protein